jgi:hypothetical protein
LRESHGFGAGVIVRGVATLAGFAAKFCNKNDFLNQRVNFGAEFVIFENPKIPP